MKLPRPTRQYFCGATYFEHQLPIDPSSMTRFRRRIGESGCELILQATVAAGLNSKRVKPAHLKRITVDTTVQEKAVSFPTDSKLLNRSRIRLVKLCHEHNVVLRQSYARKGPQALFKANRYAHARQYRRMRGRVKKLRTYLGRVVRDIERKITSQAEKQAVFAEELNLAKRLLAQQKKDKNKLYSLHAPEVECISKGKAHKRYEFGVKASIATTNKSNFVVGGMALPGNPYDGHTLTKALEQVRRMTGSVIEEAFVDRGYRGHGETQTTVFIAGQKRGIKTQRLKCSLKRREAIEPVIGHLKSDGLLGRNYLKGTEGDQMNVMLSCAGHNLRLILRQLRIFCAQIWRSLWALLASARQHDSVARRDTSITGIAWQPAINRG
ncbi:MAG: IS5 family transposase [Gammaproteobacteria bacterium]|nr:IS5 family transposase [Gammaproteobacteria bacterium]